MVKTTQSKKTETIEIRLSTETKTAFMNRCRQTERTASDVLRSYIEEKVATRPSLSPRRVPSWLIGAAGMIGVLLGVGVAAPSLARSTPEARPAFGELDRNHDGVLSYREYRAR